ncbi:hypothetical protein L7F22_013752 [Adiantum nelumboides]|nr:hypothetical protein [Adiantum nelumboides]
MFFQSLLVGPEVHRGASRQRWQATARSEGAARSNGRACLHFFARTPLFELSSESPHLPPLGEEKGLAVQRELQLKLWFVEWWAMAELMTRSEEECWSQKGRSDMFVVMWMSASHVDISLVRLWIPYMLRAGNYNYVQGHAARLGIEVGFLSIFAESFGMGLPVAEAGTCWHLGIDLCV